MLDQLKDKYRLDRCLGISLRQEADALSFRCCTVHLKKEHLDIASTWENTGWESLKNDKNKELPIALHLDARQILIKESSYARLDEEQLKELLPSYDAARFYHSFMPGEGTNWIAFVRKDYITEILGKFEALGYQVVKVFIGPFVLDGILGQINTYDHEFTFDRLNIRLNEETKQWQHFQSGHEFDNRFVLKIGDHPIKQQYLTAYAAAFATLMNDYVADYAVDVPEVAECYQSWLEKQKFKINLIVIVAVLFMLLLINSLLFSHYYQENQNLENQVSSQQSTVKDLGKLESEIKTNEQLLADLGWNGGVSKAWLLDQIGYSIRHYTQISLSQIQINPQAKGLGNILIQQTDQITVKGNSPSLEMLNLWIRELKNNPWVVRISIEEYGNKQQDDPIDRFTIKINYNDQVEGN